MMSFSRANSSTHTLPLLSGFYFFYYATIGAFLPFWSLYLEHTGFDKAQIGLLMAVTMIARVVAPSLWGYLADKTGKRMLWIRIATIAELAAWLAIFFLPANFSSFFVVMLFFSFFQNAIIPQFEAVTLFWLGENRDSYGNIRLWGSVGFIVTVFGLGVVFDFVSLNSLPIVLAVLAFICFLNALVIGEPKPEINPNQDLALTPALKPQSKETKLSQSKNSIENIALPEESYIKRLKKPKVAWFFLAQFVLLLSHAPFYSFYSNFLAGYGYSKTHIGLLWSVGVIAEIILFMYSKSLLKKLKIQDLILFCLIFTAIRWLLVALFPTLFVVQFFAQCIHAFSFALFQSVAMKLIYEEFTENQQGRAQALYSTFWGLGVAIGSVIVGGFWDTTGGVFWFAMAGILLFLFSSYIAIKKPFIEKGVFKSS